MDVWTSRSNPRKQAALSVGCTLAGVALTIACRGFRGGGPDVAAGLVLGLLLLLVGVAGVVAVGTQTVTVDPDTRRITVEDVNRFQTKTRSIPFEDVAGVGIGYLGKTSNHVTWYSLVLTLHSGGTFSLFAPGRYFPGASDRSCVVAWQRRLEGYLDLPARGGAHESSRLTV